MFGMVFAALALLTAGQQRTPEPRVVRVAQTAVPSHCAPHERIVYSCQVGKKLVSVCAGDTRVSYRYGAFAKVELEIEGRAGDGKVHRGFVTGGGGGSQNSLRFANAGYDYIVYSAVAGSLTDVPGKTWSGLVVLKDEKLVSQPECKTAGRSLDMGAVPAFVPEESEARYDAWW